MSFAYAAARVPVPESITTAHRRAWERLARPGAWWTGPERVALAAEVRNAARCPLCQERRAALTPHAVEGLHAELGDLPEAAVDAVHRLTTDPGRLTRAWFEKTLASGLGDAAYVEIIGVAVTAISIDTFHLGLGLPLEPLPAPQSGDPSRRRPKDAADVGAWVPMLPRFGRGVAASEADLYAEGPLPNVIRAMSLVPDEVRGLKDLSAAHYFPPDEVIDILRAKTLSRAQIELVAGRVSAINECFY